MGVIKGVYYKCRQFQFAPTCKVGGGLTESHTLTLLFQFAPTCKVGGFNFSTNRLYVSFNSRPRVRWAERNIINSKAFTVSIRAHV